MRISTKRNYKRVLRNLKLKSAITEIKHYWGVQQQIDQAEERIREVVDRKIKVIESETENKFFKKWTQSNTPMEYHEMDQDICHRSPKH